MCIKDSDGMGIYRNGVTEQIPKRDMVFLGEEYTVVEVVDSFKSKGLKSFKLSERPKNRTYRQIYFAPLSDIDETEMIREELSQSIELK